MNNNEKLIQVANEEIINVAEDNTTQNNSIKIKENELYEKEIELNNLKKYLDEKYEKLQLKTEELKIKEINLQQREDEINQVERNQEFELKQKQMLERQKLEEELLEEKANYLAEMMKIFSQEREKFEDKLTKEENTRRSNLDSELSKKREKLEEELNKLREKNDIDILEKKKACDSEIENERKNFEKSIKEEIEIRTKEITIREKSIKEREESLDEREEELQKHDMEVKLQTEKNNREKRKLENKKDELDNISSDLDEELEQRMSDKISRFKSEIDAKNDEIKELRSNLSKSIKERESIESFKSIYGDDPKLLQSDIAKLKSEKEELIERLSKSPSLEIQIEYDNIKKKYEEIKIERDELRKEKDILLKEQENVDTLKIEKEKVISENNELKTFKSELEQRCLRYENEIIRLGSTEQRLADREQRIKEIANNYSIEIFGEDKPNEFTEINWLNNIFENCKQYGIAFPKRILYSFHTALKIADWSSITVLAGVSGTGKSELPKLYAAFGGLNFISVPVQPSWDSQESMLGFFNSIDNRFEPQELLSFLYECTEDTKYNKYMSIVLLDEMNLAHVEHYFADFLSKLETRRGTSKDNVPTIDVKLGAGVEPYKLKLERSILWTGTMNQDETTKSLSDKVLDRGLVINFPRPKKLISRTSMGILDKIVKESGRPMLERKKWAKWIIRKVELVGEQAKEMEKYKTIVEKINDILEKVGRALGHRVWQSIEYYIVNYPTVVEEREKLTREENDPVTNKVKKISTGELSSVLAEQMKIAFEDQIVQKIMPKLRGIETRGKGRQNLQKIEDLLEENGFERLKDDFEIACEQGYGQFIWSSAKYLENDEAKEENIEDKMTDSDN